MDHEKKLLIANVVIYAIMCGISLFDAGIYYGESSYHPGIGHLVPPFVFFVLLLWEIYLLKSLKSVTLAGFLVPGIVTLSYLFLPFIVAALLLITSENVKIVYDYTWCSVTVGVCCLIAFILNLFCALLTWQEYKKRHNATE